MVNQFHEKTRIYVSLSQIFRWRRKTKSVGRVATALRNVGHTITESGRLISESKSQRQTMTV